MAAMTRFVGVVPIALGVSAPFAAMMGRRGEGDVVLQLLLVFIIYVSCEKWIVLGFFSVRSGSSLVGEIAGLKAGWRLVQS